MAPLPALHIAVIEDSPELQADLVEFLTLRGFSAQGFDSGEAFFAAWPATPFQLLLLDIVLPGISGLDVAQRVRARAPAGGLPDIIMLTALDANHDHVLGLQAGADIYLSKRSSLEVIEATCRSVQRRQAGRHPAPPGAQALSTIPPDDTAAWRLHAREWRMQAPNGSSLQLTHPEVVMLTMLFQQPGQSVTRVALLQRLGKQDTLSNLRNLDNTASRLRRKALATCATELPLRPSYGKGYTFSGCCRLVSQ
ncbi:response regulator transcription factor [Castellaniella hirudinis]|uniref:response regulator transcription factor n=1 Tax=Castellaniella hirudinis TaxID=1144617 RepID=UPI0039C3A829